MVDVQAPEIQTIYSLGIPVSGIRTKMRQEFERHRYVQQLSVVDVLIFQSHAEFQVRSFTSYVHNGHADIQETNIWMCCMMWRRTDTWQEMMNYWKQLSHVLKYFRADEDTKARLPNTFMAGFLEVSNISPILS
jgi:NADH dehydrogenase (ubiquinone) 1 alpha subcomplex subunit 6